VIRVESRALGRPLDPVLRILDAGGKVLAETDDTGRGNRDLERSFTAPADGDYRLIIRDLYGRGGLRFAYLLSVLEPRPDFALSLTADRFDLTPGKATKITVAVQRKGGLTDAIELLAEGLPAGVTSRPATSMPGDASARSVVLELSAADHSTSGPIRIVGRTAHDPRLSHAATATIDGFDVRTDRPWLTIRRARSGGPK
jgi:hypothetical protein